MSAPRFPVLPEGFKFGSLQVHCTTWEAYDSLPKSWVEKSAPRDGTGHTWKQFEDTRGWIAVHPPHEPRPEVSA